MGEVKELILEEIHQAYKEGIIDAIRALRQTLEKYKDTFGEYPTTETLINQYLMDIERSFSQDIRYN